MPKLILAAAVLLTLIASAHGGGAPKSMIGVMEAMSATPSRSRATVNNRPNVHRIHRARWLRR